MRHITHMTSRYMIVYHDEDDLLFADHYYDGELRRREAIPWVAAPKAETNALVLNAAFKALLATAAVMALMAGHSELALGIIYMLQSLIEHEQQ